MKTTKRSVVLLRSLKKQGSIILSHRVLLILMLGLAGCVSKSLLVRNNIDVVSRTHITGSVNGSALEGTVSASFNTGRGGQSTCEFPQLPPDFTPGTIGTHT